MVGTFCYLSDTKRARGTSFGNGITRIRSGWCKFRDLVPFLTSRALHLGAKSRLYSAFVCSIMLYGNETWPVKEENVIRLKRNHARMVM